jgi:hypothetical protein
MARNLFGLDISSIVNRAITSAGGVTPLSLRRVTPGARSATNPTGGLPERISTASGQGVLESFSDSQVDGTLVERGDRRVLILAASLNPAIVPTPGDEITVDGFTGRIVPDGVQQDPAAATFTCQIRAF